MARTPDAHSAPPPRVMVLFFPGKHGTGGIYLDGVGEVSADVLPFLCRAAQELAGIEKGKYLR